MQMGKEEIKLGLFTEDVIICIESPPKSTQRETTGITEFCKVAGYKINIPKSVLSSYTSSKYMDITLKCAPHLWLLTKKRRTKKKKRRWGMEEGETCWLRHMSVKALWDWTENWKLMTAISEDLNRHNTFMNLKTIKYVNISPINI